VPIAYFGAAAYIALIVLWWRASISPRARAAALLVAALGTLASGALVVFSLTVIRATCTWCIASALAMSVLFVLGIALLRGRRPLRAVSGSTVLSLAFLCIAALAVQTRFMRSAALAPPVPASRLLAVAPQKIVDTANALGPRNAPVTIVMFTDMWCPACRRIHPALLNFQRANPKTVRLVYRHLPLYQIKGHEFSGTAAALSEIAAERGRFWEFVEHIHNRKTQLNSAGYLQLMSTLGFKASAVKARLDDPRNSAAARVQRDIALAERLGIRATPTFVLLVQDQLPISAGERTLPMLLNSPVVQSKLAASGANGRQ
jgi:protein-disulfide isomerase